MDAFELGIQAGMEKTAIFRQLGAGAKRAVGAVRNVLKGGTGVPGNMGAGTMGPRTMHVAPAPGSQASTHAIQQVEKATGLKSGQLAGQMGKLSPDQLRSVSEAQKRGLITPVQAKAVGSANRTARQEQLAEEAKKNITQTLSGKQQLGPIGRTLRNVGVASAVGVPAAALMSGAGEGVEQGMMQQPTQGYM